MISLVALAVVFSLLDWHKFGQALLQADVRILLLAIVSALLWLVVRGFFWRTLLQYKASYRHVFLTVNEGYLLNNILPFRLGEIGRAFLMGRKAHIDFWQVIPSILIERALDLALAAGLFLCTLPFVIGVSWAKQAAIVTGILVLAGLLALHLLARNRQKVLAWIDRAAQRWQIVQRVAGRRVIAFFDGLAIITDGRLFLRAVGWEVLNWAVSVLEYYLFMRAFFPTPNLLWVLFALGVGALGIAAPSSPGAIGVFEAALVGALAVFGLDLSTATAFALTVHLTNYIFSGLFGGYGLYKDGESLSSLYTLLGAMKSRGAAGGPEG